MAGIWHFGALIPDILILKWQLLVQVTFKVLKAVLCHQ